MTGLREDLYRSSRHPVLAPVGGTKPTLAERAPQFDPFTKLADEGVIPKKRMCSCMGSGHWRWLSLRR